MSDADLLDLPLSRLRTLLADGEPDPSLLEVLAKDPRPGAAALLASAVRRIARKEKERARRDTMLEIERSLAREGFVRPAGVDEAGLGPLAGPVVAAAVILGDAVDIEGIDDSKKLDEAKRVRLDAAIRERALAWAIGVAEVEEIDRLNVHQAGLLAMRRAVEGLAIEPDHVLVDARRIPGIASPQSAWIKGDARSLSIAAASIVAKTFRDARMEALDAEHPGYGLAKHKGYGTPEHQAAIRRLGASPVHRTSYEAVRALIAEGRTPA